MLIRDPSLALWGFCSEKIRYGKKVDKKRSPPGHYKKNF
jgi:hypothetical protein